ADRLQVDPHEAKVIEYGIFKVFDVVAAVRRYHDRRIAEPFGQLALDLRPGLLFHQVDLIDRDERRDIDPVADHGVDEIVLRDVVADQDVGIDNLTLCKDCTDLLEIEVDGADGVQPDTAASGLLDGDIGFWLVYP